MDHEVSLMMLWRARAPRGWHIARALARAIARARTRVRLVDLERAVVEG